jgi:hypothetical protein
LTVTPVESVFVPEELATRYTVQAKDAPTATLTYTWTLTLTLVDPAGAPAPGIAGSGAAVDPGCDNTLLTGRTALGDNAYVWYGLGPGFTWYHGDVGAYPGSSYGCDHTKMGPSGHEGIVSVTVSDGLWQCRTEARGTNLGIDPLFGSTPVCGRVSASGLITFTGAKGKHEYKLTVENTGDLPIDELTFYVPDDNDLEAVSGPEVISPIREGSAGFYWSAGDPIAPGKAIVFVITTRNPASLVEEACPHRRTASPARTYPPN